MIVIVREIFPNQKIVLEHNVAKTGSLFVDIFLPQLMIAFEYDGEQHFTYSEHFHGSQEAFRASKRRDTTKSIRCIELGITLVRVRFDDKLTKDLVVEKLQQALDNKEEE